MENIKSESNKPWLFNQLQEIIDKATKDVDFLLQIPDLCTRTQTKATLLKSFVINLQSLIEDCEAKEGTAFDLDKFKKTTIEMVKEIKSKEN